MAQESREQLVETLEARARAYEAEGNSVGLIEILCELVTLLRELKEEGRARSALQQAYEVASTLEEPEGGARAFYQLGLLYYLEGGWERALELYHRALALQKKAGDQIGIATSLGNIAEVLQGKGDFKKALETYEASLAVKLEVGDDPGLAVTWNNIGTVRGRMGDFPVAMEAFRKSLEIQEKLGDSPGKAVTLANIGGLHQRQGNWRDAREVLEQSLALFEMLHDAMGMATTLNTLGFVQRRLGDLDGAYQRYSGAKELIQGLGDLLRLTIPLHNMALIHEERGEYRQALRLMEEVIGIDKRIGHPDLRQDLETFGRIREKLDRQRDQRQSD